MALASSMSLACTPGLSARTWLHGRFQERPANRTVTGDEAAGVILGGDDQLVVLEGQVGRGSGGTRGDDVAPERVGHGRANGQRNRTVAAMAVLKRMMNHLGL
jgi:hypothetical protein